MKESTEDIGPSIDGIDVGPSNNQGTEAQETSIMVWLHCYAKQIHYIMTSSLLQQCTLKALQNLQKNAF